MRTLIFTLCMMGCLGNIYADTAHIGAYVIDAVTQKPVPGIKVSASFSNDNGWKAWTESAPIYLDEQFTDANGFCELKGKTNIGKCGCGVDRQGAEYYAAAGRGFQFSSKNLFGVWQPDNLVATIRLQRVEHPIPLFVRSWRWRDYSCIKGDVFDKSGGTLRFDFLKGDYLPPVGKGEVADVEFVRHPREDMGEGVNGAGVKGRSYRYRMSMRFFGNDDGVVVMPANNPSGLKIRNAPESGYEREYWSWGGKGFDLQYEKSYDEDKCLCFRVRTKKDLKGNVICAYYGKIYGDIYFDTYFDGQNVRIRRPLFLYYLNPAPLDRNLEWDMKNNLCPNPGNIGQPQP